jgi:hypothetical protein
MEKCRRNPMTDISVMYQFEKTACHSERSEESQTSFAQASRFAPRFGEFILRNEGFGMTVFGNKL